MLRITSFHEAYDILRSPAFAASLHEGNSSPLVGDGALPTLHGGEHLERRRAEIPLMERALLNLHEQDVFIPIVRGRLADAHAQQGDLVQIDLLELVHTGLLTVSAHMLGVDGVNDPSRAQELRAIANGIGAGVTSQWTTRPLEEVMGEAFAARDRFVARFYERSRRRRGELVEAWRRGELDEAELPVDLVTLLLKRYETMDEAKLLRETLFFLTASANTTAYAVPHVVTEVLGWVDGNPHRRDDLDDPPFLQRLVGEALRLRPQTPAILRRALADTTTVGGRRIAKGTQLAIDMVAVNRDATVFGDDPERFDPDRDTGRTPPYGLSFGTGSYACLGRPIALRSTSARPASEGEPLGVLVRLLQEVFLYDVKLDPENPPELQNFVDVRYASFPLLLRRRDKASPSERLA